jgi:hypothetical protein
VNKKYGPFESNYNCGGLHFILFYNPINDKIIGYEEVYNYNQIIDVKKYHIT